MCRAVALKGDRRCGSLEISAAVTVDEVLAAAEATSASSTIWQDWMAFAFQLPGGRK
jgi:hypothetical protein